jgi:hypothetical protein
LGAGVAAGATDLDLYKAKKDKKKYSEGFFYDRRSRNYLDKLAKQTIITLLLIWPIRRRPKLGRDRLIQIRHSDFRRLELLIYKQLMKEYQNKPLTSNIIQDLPVCMHASMSEPLPPQSDNTAPLEESELNK